MSRLCLILKWYKFYLAQWLLWTMLWVVFHHLLLFFKSIYDRITRNWIIWKLYFNISNMICIQLCIVFLLIHIWHNNNQKKKNHFEIYSHISNLHLVQSLKLIGQMVFKLCDIEILSLVLQMPEAWRHQRGSEHRVTQLLLWLKNDMILTKCGTWVGRGGGGCDWDTSILKIVRKKNA